MASAENAITRANLMGLAAETRLQIYQNLLTPYLTEAQQESQVKETHSCLIDGKYGMNSSEGITVRFIYRPRCSCSGMNVYPQILAASKQTFKEAIPVLYENVELCAWLMIWACLGSELTI